MAMDTPDKLNPVSESDSEFQSVSDFDNQAHSKSEKSEINSEIPPRHHAEPESESEGQGHALEKVASAMAQFMARSKVQDQVLVETRAHYEAVAKTLVEMQEQSLDHNEAMVKILNEIQAQSFDQNQALVKSVASLEQNQVVVKTLAEIQTRSLDQNQALVNTLTDTQMRSLHQNQAMVQTLANLHAESLHQTRALSDAQEKSRSDAATEAEAKEKATKRKNLIANLTMFLSCCAAIYGTSNNFSADKSLFEKVMTCIFDCGVLFLLWYYWDIVVVQNTPSDKGLTFFKIVCYATAGALTLGVCCPVYNDVSDLLFKKVIKKAMSAEFRDLILHEV